MKLLVEGSTLHGAVTIPGSKSHTIRAVAIGALAGGESHIREPLHSSDTMAAFDAYRAFGATIVEEPGLWRVQGFAGDPAVPENVIDVGNSGTTALVALGTASLTRNGITVLTGDAQIRRRPCGPLAGALNQLGARLRCTRDNGCPPVVVEGPLRGGEASIEARTSQYVTSILLCAPLAEHATHLRVPLLFEQPYVHMTLDWLERHGVHVDYAADFSEFHIAPGQQFLPVNQRVPGDFSSATFFLAAGALPDNEVRCVGLDMNDTQGDKAVVDYVRALGADVSIIDDGVHVRANRLDGCEIDLNATPDALPMMAVLACFARGTTRLVNVPQARLKETDRIAVMCAELSKLGAKIRELEDGLVIEESALQSGHVDGHGDHRVVMALAIAGTLLPGTTTIEGYEAVNVTYPGFLEALTGLGGNARVTA